MTYIQKYSELFYSYALKHNLSEDFDDWPLENQKEFDGLYRELRAEYATADKVESFEDDEFYIIRTTVDTLDGSEEEITDVRELDLDELKNLCSLYPQYNEYYFSRVFNSQ